ncbi:ABC-2 type transport system ATP-binding protein [Bryocella elongata]|uniref:ABC-2 type transport system ATP-binding protein n=1 Tax=Bryocella elongata TaxID=863522 RepID=A0A1H5YQD4_9BACT|nr:ABC transporter ATP-binding protein [Bryocella elongata]SEG25815.1 ABC-2 type transport system ATP-binding protein [Bryocella elongata]
MNQVMETPTQAVPHSAARPSAPAVATLTNITKRYANGVVALDGLSLELRRGEIVALLGPNGAGKSTAVRLMMGLSAPTSGDVRIFGADPQLTSTRLRTGVMLQVGRAPEMLKVREHIAMFRSYYPAPASAASLVKAAGLEGLEDRLFGQLSGGQKQRVLFALALAGNPDLVFLDEPTVGLDIEARRAMWAQIRSLRDAGKTVLLTTHYLEEADALADRIIVISKGRVVREGTPAEIKNAGAAGAGAVSSGVAVKIIRCVTTLSAEHLLKMPGVNSTMTDEGRTIIISSTPESTLREMLALDQSLHSLEVQSPALEDAFLALTRND